jgi:hypothetical protein
MVHPTLIDRTRERVADKRVLSPVKAFLRAPAEHGGVEDAVTCTPQGRDRLPAADEHRPLGAR